MKINNITIVLLSFMSMVCMAQVDRTKVPALGASPKINIGTPLTYKYKNGLTLMVVENHKFPKVNISFTIDAPDVLEGDKAGVGNLTSQLLGKGSETISKEDFEDEIDFLGASVNLDMKWFYASSLTRFFPRVMELLSSVALNPNFTQQDLDKEREKLIQHLKMNENNASQIMSRVGTALIYGKNHPRGEFVTEQSLSNVTLDDVKKFYKDHFIPQNAYMIISGDITFDQAKLLVDKYFSHWEGNDAKQNKTSKTHDVTKMEIDFIDLPTAVQSEIRAGNLIDVKMSNPDYFPLLVANHIFGGDFNSYINMNLREKNGFTYGARSNFSTSKYFRSTFSVSTQVRNDVTAAAVQEIINEVERINHQYVSEEMLEIAKSKYLGSFIMAMENPSVISSYALRVKTENLPEDFYKNFINNINAVTKEDVMRVAKKYFRLDNFRIVIVGKKLDVAPSLEGLTYKGAKIPVHYYDTFANKQK